MALNSLIRRVHRWDSIVFTLTVIVNFVALGLGKYPIWLAYIPLPPLFLLLLTGLYMFALPYLPSRRSSSLAMNRQDLARHQSASAQFD